MAKYSIFKAPGKNNLPGAFDTRIKLKSIEY